MTFCYHTPYWEIKTEPFDWFSEERSANLPEHVAFQQPNQNQPVHTVTTKCYQTAFNPSYDSPEYEPERKNFVAETYYCNNNCTRSVQHQLAYPGLVHSSNSIPESYLPDVPELDLLLNNPEVLTPPQSPKDEEIIKLLQDIGPGDWERLMFDAHSNLLNACNSSEGRFTNSFMGKLSNWSPYVGSESSSDVDYFVEDRIRTRLHPPYHHLNSKMLTRRTDEERRLRKKEQNKNAAVRYRQKKKMQFERYRTEEKCLLDRNQQLKIQMEDVSREIRCLKSLMRDVYCKRGVISS